MYYLLHYEYVEDIVSKREPYRDQHLRLLNALQDNDQVILAGAVGNPVTGATFVFKVHSEDIIQSFVNNDPYVANQLVTEFVIEPWTVVVGSAYQPD